MTSIQVNPPETIETVDDDIAITVGFADSLVDYIAYRAFSKDAEHVGNQQLAIQSLDKYTLGLR